jgi:NAD(P)-dependent dehydrogenase (short-subunit alcohol dehydrogenase family)
MVTQGRGGRIIGASSIVGKQGAQFRNDARVGKYGAHETYLLLFLGAAKMAAYTSTKFAIRGLTQTAGRLVQFSNKLICS